MFPGKRNKKHPIQMTPPEDEVNVTLFRQQVYLPSPVKREVMHGKSTVPGKNNWRKWSRNIVREDVTGDGNGTIFYLAIIHGKSQESI
ncbi:hypothetical protein TNIN_217051 [Trichonephila inaurata madagascariensis]|uniref:Uncharacterized protein n=1 Tax=Trichonephila inaurata madagascariensis TaxID=2747483 RepID=A0A8X6YEM4_9ARAC|nr:hypothetical protein TNIN_217051 [Trichonephila inaurata madagascariensis]